MTDKVIAFTTCGSAEDAEKLATVLVEKKLAACVNIVPNITSIYHWNGQIEKDAEMLLVIKTSRALVDNLRKQLDIHHPYDVPELVATPIIDGAPNYLAWMEQGLEVVPG